MVECEHGNIPGFCSQCKAELLSHRRTKEKYHHIFQLGSHFDIVSDKDIEVSEDKIKEMVLEALKFSKYGETPIFNEIIKGLVVSKRMVL